MNGPLERADASRHGLFSPEGVRLDLAIAGPAPRIIAYSLDLLIIVLLLIALFVTLFASLPLGKVLEKYLSSLFSQTQSSLRPGNTNRELPFRFDAAVIAIFLLMQFAVEGGYFTFWEMVTGGRSPGKMLVGLRVVQRNGLPVDLGASVVRNVFRIVDLLPANYITGLISMLLSPGGQRLGDHVAGTIVIRLDRPPSAPEIHAATDSDPLSLTREQLARIGPREVALIRGTLRRMAAIPQDRSEALLTEVSDTLRERLEIDPSALSDRRAFLLNLLALAERYSREEAG
jgi:uncharacterized RDD family membrane protein YckC